MKGSKMRKLKTLGLALVAVFAMSAMSAAAAQANHPADFWASAGTTSVDAVAETNQKFNAGGKVVNCSVLDGTAPYTVEGNTLTASGVGFTTCTTELLGGLIKLPTTVSPGTGCHFTFTAGTFVTASDDSTGSVHICDITVKQYSDAEHKNQYCEIHVPKQTVEGLTYTNKQRDGTDTVTVDVNSNVANVTVTDFNKIGCTTHETVAATYEGSFWAQGTNALGERTDTEVTPTP